MMASKYHELWVKRLREKVNPIALRRMSTSVKGVICKIISMTWRDAIRYVELVDSAV